MISEAGLEHTDPGLRRLRRAHNRVTRSVIDVVQDVIRARCICKGCSEDDAMQDLRRVKLLRSSRLLRLSRQPRAGATVTLAGSWVAEAVELDLAQADEAMPGLRELASLHTLRQVGKKREFTTDALADALVRFGLHRWRSAVFCAVWAATDL